MAAAARFTASFCRSRRFAFAVFLDGFFGQAGAGRSCVAPSCPGWARLGRFGKAAQRAWAARAGMRRLRGKNGHARSKADNRLGRQYGSLFPTPLHSTVWATKKNWTRQRRK
jgi:hypothetical protein